MSSITFKDIKIIDSVCSGVGLIVTVVRLALRLKSGRIWWDDALAFFSSLCLALTSVAIGLHYGGPYAYSIATRLAAYYLIAEGFYITLWTARLAILFSIIRIVPEKAQKRFLYRTAIAFAAVLVFLLVQVFWVCEGPSKQAWKAAPNPQCSLGLQVAVCQLVTDIISDLLLIVVPVRLLARTHLERGLKIRLVIIFSATMLTTVVSLVHAAYLLEVRGVDAIISAIVEISVCIVVCNLVVVVPAMYRAFGWRADDDPRRHGPEQSYRISSFRFRIGRSWASSGTDASSMGVGLGTAATGAAGATGTTTGTGASDGVIEQEAGKKAEVQEENSSHEQPEAGSNAEKGAGRGAKIRWERELGPGE